jgi:hypothetical protein
MQNDDLVCDLKIMKYEPGTINGSLCWRDQTQFGQHTVRTETAWKLHALLFYFNNTKQGPKLVFLVMASEFSKKILWLYFSLNSSCKAYTHQIIMNILKLNKIQDI